MLAFTSIGAKIDHSVTSGNGPYAFRIHGQNHHQIGSLLPVEGKPPQFAQLYIYDTANEVRNRLSTLSRTSTAGDLDGKIVAGLIQMMDDFNCLAKIFRKARDRYESGDIQDFRITIVEQKRRGKQYELPISEEIAGLIVGDMSTTTGERDVVLELKASSRLHRISDLHPLFMSLQYPLLFPYGQYGFNEEIPYIEERNNIKRSFVTIREFYAYQIQTRLSEGMTIVKAGRLFQQYVVDAYTTIEQERIRWTRNNQKILRADLYNNVFDAVDKGDINAKVLGRRVILPPSFTGGPRYMVEKYHDAMALCRWFGNPDLFVTVTANPKWQEITDHLNAYGGDSAFDRPDIECRVFKMKLDDILSDFSEGVFFPKPIAVIYTIEFQKRGLPHAHILLWLEPIYKTPTANDIDQLISAELPDKETDFEGFKLVEQHMMHGPCGYIIYRRRNDVTKFVMKGDVRLDNRFVVPHNLQILKKYKAHINVEWCSKSSAIKYLFKYITKGVDKATIIIQKGTTTMQKTDKKSGQVYQKNEIDDYLECRYLSACEAAWRIFSFHIHYQRPPVTRLSIHLPDQQSLIFDDSTNLQSVVSRPGTRETMFTEWMNTNNQYEEARGLTYVEFPTKYVWNNTGKYWTQRKQGFNVGRVVNIHPAAGELYYLRMLINIVKGPRNYDEIYTFAGVKYNTFKEACQARGLLGGDNEWNEAIEEAAKWAGAAQLRHLFVTLLLYCEVGEPHKLWDKCWKPLAEDIQHKKQKEFSFPNLYLADNELQQYALIEIEKLLMQNEKSLRDFPNMPKPDKNVLRHIENTLLREELQFDESREKEEHQKLFPCLNEDQKTVYDAVIDSIDNGRGKLFFVYGAGGTGKTFLYKTIISKLRSEKKIVLPVASSGIAALLLPGGRTAHSRFKIPLNVHDTSTCDIKQGTMLAELLARTELIIWDEAPMAHRHTFETLDRTLKDLMSIHDESSSDKPFGGKTVLLGGDFRQILPVVQQGGRPDTVLATLSRSYLWAACNVYMLTRNLRLNRSEIEFAKWILQVGNGTARKIDENTNASTGENKILIDETLMLCSMGDPLQVIVDAAYPRFLNSFLDQAYLTERAILTPRNETVDEVNAFILSKIPGQATEYLSSDSIGIDNAPGTDWQTLYPVEYLNSLEFPGLPSYRLHLKVGAPVMMLRNINQKEGLCNGTRLIITQLGKRVLEAEIMIGPNSGNKDHAIANYV
ncbi:PREDICTED: uncharacterized protein LOC104814022 [Tarenaya hassleriana]|uniref:uncharacterized protein LOC104814022 n=1 Tax=Tarenaya hassleriana TaxID=28532 RepID=UPI0008FD7666|nr:PREDICTED: uncharacterized protein LOC104814022 [Tarenaya hassleriana]